ncbi:hypothetical protein QEN19_000812 [Hanseniaspora menglaensis]
MKYGMIKISTSTDFQSLLSNNLADKEKDLKFKIKVREQNLNELEISNRANKFFDHQLKAFDTINMERERKISSSITTSQGEFFSAYDIYVEIIKIYNSGDMDSNGRYTSSHSNGSFKRTSRPLLDLTSEKISTNKRRKSLRNQVRKNYSSDKTLNQELFEHEGLSNDEDWKLPDPKQAKFLQIPEKTNTTSSKDSIRFWKSLTKDYMSLYKYYETYLKDYLIAIYKYEGDKPWLNKNEFKSNGISIIHHFDTEPNFEIKEENDNIIETVDKCKKCNKTKKLYQCSYCQEFYHKTCIPLLIGKFGRLCDNCFLGNFEYGFQELEENITIHEFKEKFSNDTSKTISTKKDVLQLEKQFWNTVYGDKLFKCFYGADIHNDTKGYISGFENQKNKNLRDSFLNLMNLPNDKNTLLPLINDISGISLPWCYFGSKFSVFGIHQEDHFAYSINYQFAGDYKIWYCIKIEDSDKFHQYISRKYPDFIRRQKDILHQLTTTISPYDKDIHKSMGITFYKAVQHPGEYIITFPKCWHFGFNSGINHNEAVNFILPNWIPFAIEADKVYKRDKRKNVFDIYKLIEKNIILNNDTAYSEAFFNHTKLLSKELNRVEEIIKREIMSVNYKSDMIDLTTFNKSFMTNELSCDCCKKICSFSMVLVFTDLELYHQRKNLSLKDILINSNKLNGKDSNNDVENLNNFIESNVDQTFVEKKIRVFCTTCYIEEYKNISNNLQTQSYYLKDVFSLNKMFKRDPKYFFPIDFI